MRLAYFLISLFLVAVVGGYTLPETVMKGPLNMTNHVIWNVSAPVNDTDVAIKSTVTSAFASYLPLAGGTLTGWLNLSNIPLEAVGVPVNESDAATKKYVDDNVLGGGLPTTGGTMTGEINMSGHWIYGLGSPANDSDSATKKYVDDGLALYLPLTGGVVTGQTSFSDVPVLDVGVPVNETDAATKKYVDDNSGGTVVESDLWTKINKTGDTMSGSLAMGSNNITGVLNGTADQDAVTYSQFGQPSRNITYDGYVQSGQLAPTNPTKVFLYIVPWFGTNVAVALRSNGLPVSIGTDNATVINTAISSSDTVILYDQFEVTSTIWLNNTCDLIGGTRNAGLKGAVTLLETDNTNSHKFTISCLNLTTTSSNIGMFINKTVPVGGIIEGYELCDCRFYSTYGQGNLTVIRGVNDCRISRCWFESPYEGRNNTTNTLVGIYMYTTSDTEQVMNVRVSGCNFFNLGTAIKDDAYSVSNANMAGNYVTDCFMIACATGVYWKGMDMGTITGCMLDNVGQAVYLYDSYRCIVSNNNLGITFATNTVNQFAIGLECWTFVSDNNKIVGNTIYCYDTAGGIWMRGKSATDHFLHTKIQDNTINLGGATKGIQMYAEADYAIHMTELFGNQIFGPAGSVGICFDNTNVQYTYYGYNKMSVETAVSGTGTNTVKESYNYNNNGAV